MRDFSATVGLMPQATGQEAISENVRVGKARRRVSDAAIAEAIGISRSALNDRMNNKARWQVDELQAVAGFLEISLHDLLTPSTAVS